MDECYFDGNDFCVSQDDILSGDMLPGSFLFVNFDGRNDSVNNGANNLTVDGTYVEALNKMDYHRKRMNEYLCHGFMAEEIFRDMRSIRSKRRQDVGSMNGMPDFFGDDNVTVHDKMLSDEGSTKYKEWLHRTTTLDDVYRHYAPRKKLRKKISIPNLSHNIEDFDGEVTGFAMPAHVSPDKTGYYDYPDDDSVSSPTGHHSSHHSSGVHQYIPHEDTYPVIHEEHYYHSPSHHDDEEYWHKESYHKGKGELTIKDFFEIALTALAFLAFGLFVMQLLMAITNSSTTTATTESIRFKRDIPSSPYNSNAELNELSHRVLQSIEAAMVAKSDSGDCLKWTLCRDNQYSKHTTNAQRVWIPMWSLGMSWVSGRMMKQSMWPAMFESIKASILGLGGGNCNALYPNCDLDRERRKRRRRRRKK
ncbi:hypothetical protein PV327_001771 [Microctonus hyperodae]|uniref:Uncharacterized protein n=1 Tax=Microctonus hyperodae TaxID=165561 RepID=A0AA39FE60_MICHY|nr:hypothetical protein PV327_001771 [Microctonus hyperodae]